jgi:hypothetical protein
MTQGNQQVSIYKKTTVERDMLPFNVKYDNGDGTETPNGKHIVYQYIIPSSFARNTIGIPNKYVITPRPS